MRLVLIALCLMSAVLLQAQKPIAISHDNFRVDNLGNFQVVYNGSLDLYNSRGVFQRHFSENLLGSISAVDRNSSLKLLAFYGDIPGFQLLDNTLSPHSQLYDLSEAGFGNISLVCMSTNNSYWAYDAVSFEILRFDDNYRLITNSGNLNLILDRPPVPSRMLEHEGKLYVMDPGAGLYIFDSFGTYEHLIPAVGIVDFDIQENQVYIALKTELRQFDLKSGKTMGTSVLDYQIKALDVTGNQVYLGDGKLIRLRTLDSLFG